MGWGYFVIGYRCCLVDTGYLAIPGRRLERSIDRNEVFFFFFFLFEDQIQARRGLVLGFLRH